MGKTKLRTADRILALILSLIMVIGIMPITASASTVTNPGVFTVVVKDGGNNNISGATVAYDIKVNGLSDKTGSVLTSNGEAVIADMADYAAIIAAGVDTVSVAYTVSKTGFTDSTGTETVTDATGNINVVMVLAAQDTVTITVTPTGSGIVMLDGVATNSVTVHKGSDVAVQLIPSTDCYIKSLNIGGNVTSVTKGEPYSTTLTNVQDNTNISVAFVKEYTVSVSSNTGGSVKLDGNNVTEKDYDENSNAAISVTPAQGYQIASVYIGGIVQSISDVTSFIKTVQITTDTTVAVSFVKVYTISVSFNENGTVVTDPACSGGSVTVNTGTSVDLTATPNATYRVSKIVVNSNETTFDDNTYNSTNAYTDTYTANKDYSIEITFAPLVYNVTAKSCTNGSVTIDNPKVDYNDGTTVHIYPEVGYTVDTVTVNGRDTAVDTPDAETIKFDIDNITEDKEIEVKFKTVSTANMSDVSFNYTDALRANIDGTFYVFENGETVTFSTGKNGIKINGSGSGLSFTTQSVDITETKTITKIELYYKAPGDWIPSWHTVSNVTQNNPMRIVIDSLKPTPTLTPATANTNGYYNNDVSVAVNAEDTGDYSGLSKVEYWITNNGAETKPATTLYSFDGTTIKNTYSGNIIVNAEDNNSDNVVVHLKVTDRAGNVQETNATLKINITKPTVSVSINGTLHSEATAGYYNTSRTATITIVDRNSSFDENAANNGISITAKNASGENVTISKAAMISTWSHSGDTHTATISFSTDANYLWDISYKNKADLTNVGVATTGESVYSFAVDTTAPTGNISVAGGTWNRLLSTLTFGLWKNYSVTATAIANDVTSPKYDIKYYKTNLDTALTEAQLVSLFVEGKFTAEAYTVSADEQFTVYARLTDYAGNTLYIGSNGVIVDMTDGNITLTPDNANTNGFYNDSVNVDITVEEETVAGKAYSGIKTIDYKVIKDNDLTNPTQSGNLYSFTEANPVKSDLKKTWSGNITVDKSKNNSDNIKVIVSVTDNAGNDYSKEISLAINTDRPTITVDFDNNAANKTVGSRGYYGDSRQATVTIVDRNSAFNETKATAGIIINAVDAENRAITLDRSSMISEWSHNDDTHTATIDFTVDGNYTWSLSYTNDADNANTEVSTGSSVTPFTFTVDTTDPSGTITVNTNTWDSILNTLTFGFYNKVKADVSATADDDTSPVTIEYYKTSNPIALSATELDNQTFVSFNPFSVESDEQFVIYLKVTDNAGNYIYINSDGYIVDKVSSNIVLTPEVANGFYNTTANEQDGQFGIYKSDLNVAVSVTDATPYSGIKTVDYWIVKDNDNEHPTQSGNLYTFDIDSPTQAQLADDWSGNIAVNSSLNNSCNIVVYVKTVDNAGNVKTESVKLDMDITAPTIDITFDNNTDNRGNTFFAADRTATIVITERTHHFNAEKATDGIVITAVDAKGNRVENSYSVSSWNTQSGATPDESKHTASIAFSKDANYTFAIAYTDEAGNANRTPNTHDSVAPYKFTVDTTNPTGTVKAVSEEGRTEEWNELNTALTFGFWSNKKITLSGTSDDITSPDPSVVYYKEVSQSASDHTSALSKTQLDAITSWHDFDGFNVKANEQFTVYIKITDKAGNYSYISTNGLIVDDQLPLEEAIAPEITVTPVQPINGIYNGDVKVAITVDDPLVGGTYSGLKEVSYAVFDRTVSTTEPTQNGVLYRFTNSNPKQEELLKTWSGDITVDSSKNNSNDIRIIVYAKDNSLNSSEDFTTIKLDTTAPVIDISYDNNSADSSKYFKDNRTATIVVTERNFKSDDVKISITNTDSVIPSVTSWVETIGSGNLDNTKWTATITYAADGDYTFNIGYTDLAGNNCTSTTYAASTVAGTEFTIDKTRPTIDISYDNNSALNTNYYKADRTATIVISEHNFDAERVKIDLTATDDGANATIPTVSKWASNGDKHTATIHYTNDSLYTFDITYDDKAGNAAADFDKQVFYVDKTVPTLSITGVADQSANKGDVIPVVSYMDTNYDSENVTITLTGANRKAVTLVGSYSDAHNGRVFTFTNFAKEKSIDDIYTLTATLTDKAGNASEQTINFSVNRFGSTYALSESASSLNGSFVKEPVDIVLTETNANELKNIKITLFKNDKTITLKEKDDYKIDVEGGNGQWYKYTYTIFKKNFTDDGVYRITLHSEDAAGNVAENTLDTKDVEVSFGIDKTLPNIIVSNLESGKTYPVDKLTVQMAANDNLKLASVVVWLDGKEYKSWSEDELNKLISDGGKFNFDVSGDSTSAHTVKIVCIDAAGNEITEEITDFFVTTNLWVRYYNNKLLFFGSIGGVLLLAAGLVILIVLKKKNKLFH